MVPSSGSTCQQYFAPAAAAARLALFGDNRVIGKMLSETRDDHRFGAAIRFRDDVHFALVGNLFGAVELAAENGASFARGFDGYIQELLMSSIIRAGLRA